MVFRIYFPAQMKNLTFGTAAAKSLQSCPTQYDPIDGLLPGSSVPGILQARTLEWVAISFSNGGKWKVKVKSPSRVRLLVTPWTAAHQAPPSMGFFRQEYWSGVPLPLAVLTKHKICVTFSWTSLSFFFSLLPHGGATLAYKGSNQALTY